MLKIVQFAIRLNIKSEYYGYICINAIIILIFSHKYGEHV